MQWWQFDRTGCVAVVLGRAGFANHASLPHVVRGQRQQWWQHER